MLAGVIRRTVWMAAGLSLVVVGSARAQDPRVEIGGSAAWTLSDGVTFDGILAGDGNLYSGIEPKDSFSYSLNLGFFVTPQVEVGFLFSQQKSTLQVVGTTNREIGDQASTTTMATSPASASPTRACGPISSPARPPTTAGCLHGRWHLGQHLGQQNFSGTLGAGLKLCGKESGFQARSPGRPPASSPMRRVGGATPTGACVVSNASTRPVRVLPGGLIIRF